MWRRSPGALAQAVWSTPLEYLVWTTVSIPMSSIEDVLTQAPQEGNASFGGFLDRIDMRVVCCVRLQEKH